MSQDLTTYLTNAKAVIGNAVYVIRAYPYYYHIGASTITEVYAVEGGHIFGGNFYATRVAGSYPFNAVPDAIAASLQQTLNYKVWKTNLNKGKVTSKP